MADDPLRTHVLRLLDWEDAHVNFDSAVAGIPPSQRGVTPPGLPYSAWQLLEHLRLTQEDILDFCRNSSYQERKWPDDYWPASDGPPSSEEWERSIAEFQRDREELKRQIPNATSLLAFHTERVRHTCVNCSSWQTITPTM